MSILVPNPKPSANIWYKNPLVLIFVIGLPLFTVLVCIYFIIWSLKIQDSTVRDDWYMDGKTLYQDASRDKLAYDKNIYANGKFLGYDAGDTFELSVTGDAPSILQVQISHATEQKFDQDLIATRQGERYVATLHKPIIHAKYYIQISAGEKDWRLLMHRTLPSEHINFAPMQAFAP